MATRAEVHVEYDRVARGGGVGEDPRLALLLGPALLGNRAEIRLQRELERLRGIEQPATRRPGRVGRRLWRDGLCSRTWVARGTTHTAARAISATPAPPAPPAPHLCLTR